jgi:hypothetical protein
MRSAHWQTAVGRNPVEVLNAGGANNSGLPIRRYRLTESKLHASGFKPKTVASRLSKLHLQVPQTRGVEFYPSALGRGERSGLSYWRERPGYREPPFDGLLQRSSRSGLTLRIG